MLARKQQQHHEREARRARQREALEQERKDRQEQERKAGDVREETTGAHISPKRRGAGLGARQLQEQVEPLAALKSPASSSVAFDALRFERPGMSSPSFSLSHSTSAALNLKNSPRASNLTVTVRIPRGTPASGQLLSPEIIVATTDFVADSSSSSASGPPSSIQAPKP